jgi:hypothetical protein
MEFQNLDTITIDQMIIWQSGDSWIQKSLCIIDDKRDCGFDVIAYRVANYINYLYISVS